jgi:hypothetical protein
MKTMTTIATYRDEGTITTAAAAEALAVIRSQEQSGVDDASSHSYQQKRCSMEGAQGTLTLIKTASEDLRISSSSAGNFFISVEPSKKGCRLSNQWPAQ